MKEKIESTETFRYLNEFINAKLSLIEGELHRRQLRKEFSERHDEVKLSPEQQNFQNQLAAKVIQRFWRTAKVKKAIANDSYQAYLSLVDTADKQSQISSMMFGRHIAELSLWQKERSKNPILNTKQSLTYHRLNEFSDTLFDYLFKEFNIPQEDIDKNLYFPISLLQNTSIEEIIHHYFPSPQPPITLIKQGNRSIALLAIPKDNEQVEIIKHKLGALGVIATLWEITANIKDETFHVDKTYPLSRHAGLPKTQDALLKSSRVGLLSLMGNSQRHPTRLLAQCVYKIIHQLPNLSQDAIQRIALMIDLANTFYAFNYSQYAFSVYTIIHEISLALLQESTPVLLEKSYRDFLSESETSLLRSLDINKDQLEHSAFIAVPAISGTNAYAIAMQLACKMQTQTGEIPTVKVIAPNYYEFEAITQSTTEFEPDIFVISVGPIVKPGGLVPGIDINKFVRRNLIQNHSTKPITIVVDATTALYKNLKLDDDLKQLVQQGRLSIIVHESHQKFGLLHTDQSQYGRVLALYAKPSFSASVIDDLQKKSKIDFNEHVDMRIGAFISTSCGETLEEIKQQHFRNGSLLGKSSQITLHEDMLTNPEEHYFYCSPHFQIEAAASAVLEPRASFGHYSTTTAKVGVQTRISFDASDTIDALIQGACLCIAMKYPNFADLHEIIIEHANQEESLTLDNQMVCLAILNIIATRTIYPPEVQNLFDGPWVKVTQDLEKLELKFWGAEEVERKKAKEEAQKLKGALDSIELLAAMRIIFKQCNLLKGRHLHAKIGQYLEQLQGEIIYKNHLQDGTDFLKATQVLFEQHIKLTPLLYSLLKSNQLLCQLTIKMQHLLLTESMILEWAVNPEKLLINCDGQQDLTGMSDLSVPFSL